MDIIHWLSPRMVLTMVLRLFVFSETIIIFILFLYQVIDFVLYAWCSGKPFSFLYLDISFIHSISSQFIIGSEQDKSWRVRYMVANQLYELCEAVGPEPTRYVLHAAWVLYFQYSIWSLTNLISWKFNSRHYFHAG